MSVDLEQLPDDEEIVRRLGGIGWPNAHGDAIQNVLDALNYYRCKAKFAEQELARALVGALGK